MNERFAERERERESKLDSAVFEWLRARARARAANAVEVPAGMFSLIADLGVILFVSGVSNLIVVADATTRSSVDSIAHDLASSFPTVATCAMTE